MKAIQVTFDEALLSDLDADEDVRAHGRSAVLRRAAIEYLHRRQAERIDEQYRRAYGASPGRPDALAGWAEEGTWPET